MGVVGGDYQLLQSRLESILIRKGPSINIFLDLVEATEQIRRRLLIARWRVLYVGRMTLELKRIIIIFQESSCDSGVEGHAGETVIGVLGKDNDL